MTAPRIGRPDPAGVPGMAEHIDHEMSRLLWIGETVRCWRLLLPDTVVRALRVAYAAHARAVLDFFHDGRPGKTPGGDRKDWQGDFDIWLGDYTGTFDAHPWDTAPPIHRDRLRDADKLVGHISTGRPGLASRPEWGDQADRVWVRALIEDAKADLAAAGQWGRFPETERALAETRS